MCLAVKSTVRHILFDILDKTFGGFGKLSTFRA